MRGFITRADTRRRRSRSASMTATTASEPMATGRVTSRSACVARISATRAARVGDSPQRMASRASMRVMPAAPASRTARTPAAARSSSSRAAVSAWIVGSAAPAASATAPAPATSAADGAPTSAATTAIAAEHPRGAERLAPAHPDRAPERGRCAGHARDAGERGDREEEQRGEGEAEEARGVGLVRALAEHRQAAERGRLGHVVVDRAPAGVGGERALEGREDRDPERGVGRDPGRRALPRGEREQDRGDGVPRDDGELPLAADPDPLVDVVAGVAAVPHRDDAREAQHQDGGVQREVAPERRARRRGGDRPRIQLGRRGRGQHRLGSPLSLRGEGRRGGEVCGGEGGHRVGAFEVERPIALLDHRVHRGEAVLRRLREQARDERLDGLRHGDLQGGERRRRLVDVRLHQLRVRAARRRAGAPASISKSMAPSAYWSVRAVIAGAPPLLRRHVRGRAEGHPRGGELHRLRAGLEDVELGDAEVEHAHARRPRVGRAGGGPPRARGRRCRA